MPQSTFNSPSSRGLSVSQPNLNLPGLEGKVIWIKLHFRYSILQICIIIFFNVCPPFDTIAHCLNIVYEPSSHKSGCCMPSARMAH